MAIVFQLLTPVVHAEGRSRTLPAILHLNRTGMAR
jgi:hypothetical protein